jgi:hypothetical protein
MGTEGYLRAIWLDGGHRELPPSVTGCPEVASTESDPSRCGQAYGIAVLPGGMARDRRLET